MFTAYVVVAVATALANGVASAVDFRQGPWILANLEKCRVPRSWLYPLGAAKTAGALGLLAGLAVPPLGIAAAACLTAYFVGAVITVLRARAWSQVAYPTLYLALSAATLALALLAGLSG
ncbi:DoxX family protein [Saccharopolyspora taberi]|uniref:DoxX family protein n=1 Tax=Saccharopolyspora taberi TaxID=60895 RepID=A0ABN3VLN1_9PSEU